MAGLRRLACLISSPTDVKGALAGAAEFLLDPLLSGFVLIDEHFIFDFLFWKLLIIKE